MNHPSVGLDNVTEETRAAALTGAESQRVDTTTNNVLQDSMGEPVVARDSSTFVNNGDVSSTVARQTEFTTTDELGLGFRLLTRISTSFEKKQLAILTGATDL